MGCLACIGKCICITRNFVHVGEGLCGRCLWYVTCVQVFLISFLLTPFFLLLSPSSSGTSHISLATLGASILFFVPYHPRKLTLKLDLCPASYSSSSSITLPCPPSFLLFLLLLQSSSYTSSSFYSLFPHSPCFFPPQLQACSTTKTGNFSCFPLPSHILFPPSSYASPILLTLCLFLLQALSSFFFLIYFLHLSFLRIKTPP